MFCLEADLYPLMHNSINSHNRLTLLVKLVPAAAKVEGVVLFHVEPFYVFFGVGIAG